MSVSLRPHELQHARPPCPSPTPGVYSNSCPLSRWRYPTISSSVIFSSGLQSFPASESFLVSQFFALGGQSIRVSASASVLPMNMQGLALTGLISFKSKWVSGVFSNTAVQKHQFLDTQCSLWSTILRKFKWEKSGYIIPLFTFLSIYLCFYLFPSKK